MKKILLSLILCFLLISGINCFALNDGLYEGSFILHVDNPAQCTAAHNPGTLRITHLDNNEYLFQNVVFWPNEIVVSERICVVNGNAILCPPEDQIIDLSQYELDAIITNKADHGAGVISEDEFEITYSMKKNTCEGSDCDIASEWFGISFPCNVGPWKSKFVKIDD